MHCEVTYLKMVAIGCRSASTKPVPRRGALTMAVLFALLLIAIGPAHAQTETVLYSFCSQLNCTDGYNPFAGLVMDKKGNLYGTTYQGGANANGGNGTVFEITVAGEEKVLYSFTGSNGDAGNPYAGLVMDKRGNLYGTTVGGGVNGSGAVFELSPSGTETVLYSFCSQPSCTDGATPYAGLVMDKKGNLYGTTYQGGVNGNGTVFEISPSGTETVLHSFAYSDGASPLAGLVIDQKGNLYGTTTVGGVNGNGTVFEITAAGEEKVLYSFTGSNGDGEFPYAGLVMDKKGNFYGTTELGGANGNGTVFEIIAAGEEKVLYSFTGSNGDGDPVAGLVMDKKGNLYGTTVGTVFKVSPSGTETVLYVFCSQSGCTDGAGPMAGLAMDRQGNLYGTTSYGGANGVGVVFKVTP